MPFLGLETFLCDSKWDCELLGKDDKAINTGSLCKFFFCRRDENIDETYFGCNRRKWPTWRMCRKERRRE